MNGLETELTRRLKIELPIICGAMFPCSNPELVAAASEAGGMGVIQPISLTYIWGHSFRDGIRKIKSLTSKPFGMNVLVERSSRIYEKRMQEWTEIALEEGCRFFVTALGNPREICKQVKAAGGTVFHDVTEKKWALKALENGVDGLICVNNRAGGHAGTLSPEDFIKDFSDLKVPLVCAGGIGDEKDFRRALSLGYCGVQMGTRFIATKECLAHPSYKEAILRATEKDIVLTERITGIPVAVIRTPYVDLIGTKVGPIAKFLFKHRRTKEWIRIFYNLRAAMHLRKSVHHGLSTKDYWQAGKSVEHIESIETVKDVMARFAKGQS